MPLVKHQILLTHGPDITSEPTWRDMTNKINPPQKAIKALLTRPPELILSCESEADE